MVMPDSAGYSATPLAKKLGIKAGHLVALINQPAAYFDLFPDWPVTASLVTDEGTAKDVIHFFTTDANDLNRQLPVLLKQLKPNGMIWVSWPKKAAKLATDVTEDLVRAAALRNGLVDVKVCAVDAVWSGLKLVIPLAKRK